MTMCALDLIDSDRSIVCHFGGETTPYPCWSGLRLKESNFRGRKRNTLRRALSILFGCSSPLNDTRTQSYHVLGIVYRASPGGSAQRPTLRTRELSDATKRRSSRTSSSPATRPSKRQSIATKPGIPLHWRTWCGAAPFSRAGRPTWTSWGT